ncbi:unnamed protein product, partial [Closterium sp. NIES-64]
MSPSALDNGVVPDVLGRPNSLDGSMALPFDAAAHGAAGATAGNSPMVAMAREARVMRYREKRKNRKFEKTIRYASRKAYAESRPRVK